VAREHALQRWCRHLFGIAVAAFATGPALIVLVFMTDLFSEQPWAALMVRFENWDLGRIPLGLVQLAAWSAPFVAIHALVLFGLRRLRIDSLTLAGLTGGLVACLAVFGLLVSDEEIDLVPDVPLAFGLGAAIGGIYWFVVNRVERRAAHDRLKDAEAIAAMD
jgi:hypothetical protein